jgi:hypothetical protein|tara:strand:+ start:2386 stop:2856 length:471 start_codon:yes stop_codon:yes gene_type:complete
VNLYGQRRERFPAFVVFQRPLTRQPWHLWTSPLFSHCWIFRPIWFPEQGLAADEFTLKIEFPEGRIDVAVWWASTDSVLEAFLDAEVVTDILRVRVDADDKIGYMPKGLMTCVSGLKAFLGVRAWWVLTPRQLYQHLRRKGARSLRWETSPNGVGV